MNTFEKLLADKRPTKAKTYKAQGLRGGYLRLPESVHERLRSLGCYAYAIQGSRNTYQVFNSNGNPRTILTLAIVGNGMTISSADLAINSLVNTRWRGY